jgi:ABC-2 type transport system permease protein
VIGNVVRIARKDLRLLWADKFGLFWVLVFPLVMAPLFGSIFGGGGPAGEMAVAVVDLDGSDGSRRFVELLDASDALRVWRPTDGETGEPIGVTEAMARDQVRTGSLTAFLVIPAGYSGDGLFGGLGAELRVGIDPSRRAEAGYLQGLIMEATFARLREVFTDREAVGRQLDTLLADVDTWEIDPLQRAVFRRFLNSSKAFTQNLNTGFFPDNAEDPGADGDGPADSAALDPDPDAGGFRPVRIEVEEIVHEGVGPRSAFEVSFPQAMIWALIGSCATFALTLVRERKEGTLLRLRIAPQPPGAILAGKALACFLTCVGSLATLTTIAHLLFGMRIESYPLYALGVLCIGVCFVGIMMAIATIGTTEESVSGAGWGVLLILAMLGGGMVPLIIMPPWLVALSKVSPVRWAIWSMEGAVWRGLGFEQLLPAYAVLLGVGIATFALGVVVFKRRGG